MEADDGRGLGYGDGFPRRRACRVPGRHITDYQIRMTHAAMFVAESQGWRKGERQLIDKNAFATRFVEGLQQHYTLLISWKPHRHLHGNF